MGQVTHEHADLLLKLYEVRREPRLRQARQWMMTSFTAQNFEEVKAQCPPGSDGDAFLRMTLSYWDMCANMVNRGLIDEEFFFESTGEQYVIWSKVQPVVAEIRALFKNPHFLAPLEEHCKRLEAWREKRAPGSNEALKGYIQQMAEAARGKAKSA